jgi:hypothetical protein
MSASDPTQLLGQRENEKLEFKAAEILKNPSKIAREVVGFLNHEGGEIWIGVQEKDGMAVPPLQDIPAAQGTINALRDHLIATIEPPIRDEFDLKTVPTGAGGALIKITVRQGARGPYAQIDRGRHFLIRVTDRLRDMSRLEIDQRIRNASPNGDDIARIVEDLRKEQEDEATKQPPRLWIRLQPTPPLGIDFDDKEVQRQFECWLTDARTTGNRPTGITFVHAEKKPRPREGRIEGGDDTIPWFTEVTESGRITFMVDTTILFVPQHDSSDTEIKTYTLLELPVSVFRFAKTISERFASQETDRQIVAGLVISGLGGARLRAGSPRYPQPPPKEIRTPVIDPDPARYVFAVRDVIQNPDRYGMRLVRSVYDAFDFGPDALPPEFDAKLGVLHLPK